VNVDRANLEMLGEMRGPGLPSEVDGGYRLMLFADQDAITTADVVVMWVSEVGIPEPAAKRRASDLLAIATAPDGRLAAVCTAYLQRNDQLRADAWYLRMFVGEAHRRAHLSFVFTLAVRDHLQDRFVSGEDPRAIGIVAEYETDAYKYGGSGELSQFIRRGYWHMIHSFFIGENARGDFVRVHYFPGAHAPEPDA
jgi:hypothetical protein